MEDLLFSGTGNCGETVGRLDDLSHFGDKNKTKEEIHPSVEPHLKPSDWYQGGGRGGAVGGGWDVGLSSGLHGVQRPGWAMN